MQKKEEKEKKGLTRNHPGKLCRLLWTIPKWLLVILFIVFVLALLDFSRIMDFVLIIVAIAVPPVIIKIKGAGRLRDLAGSMYSAIIKVKEDGLCQIVFVYYIVLIIAAFALMVIYKRSIIQIVAIIAVIVFALMMVEKIKSMENSKKEECEQENLCSLDAWEIYKHADNLYHQRFNFFLVAESMLIVSFATTLLVDQENLVLSAHINSIRIAITILGMVFTISWFYVNDRINRRLNYLNKEYLKRCSQTYGDYLNSVNGISSTFFMTNFLPAATFAFWYYLLYITVKLL